MSLELLIRFVAGGIVVSFFAMLGSAFKPKSFAGLLGAAPSVALATLSLTVLGKGKPYAAIEAQSMVLGAVSFLIYAFLVCRLLMRTKFPTLLTTSVAMLAWLVCAIGLRLILFR
jgi:hypothetical protein